MLNIKKAITVSGILFNNFVSLIIMFCWLGICAEITLTILDVSAPSNPTNVGYVALPDIAYGVYVQGNFAYVAKEI